MLGLAVVYRVGPSRKAPRWRCVDPGALRATVLWIAVAVGFSVYVGSFGRYNETHGTLGGVIVRLIWLWISAFAVLLGAEVNAEAEHQARRDGTTGARGAAKADTTGRSP
jgi:membrane protein